MAEFFSPLFQINVPSSKRSPTKNPTIICSDIFGLEDEDPETGKSHFVSAFKRQLASLDHVEILSVAADARVLPLPNQSVNVIWDRLGASWHSIVEDIILEVPINSGSLARLLSEYQRVLKPQGVIVIDAIAHKETADQSTIELSQLSNVDFEKMFGLSVSYIGDGLTKLAVLSRVR